MTQMKNPQTFSQRSCRPKRSSCRTSRPCGTRARSAAAALISRRTTGASTRVDFDERSRSARFAGTGFDGLADRLCRARAVLHEGRMGHRCVGTRRREPVRSAALQALSDAAAAGEILRRAVRAWRAQARPASIPRTDGDQLAALPRPAGLRALWLLPRLRVRVAAKSSTLVTMIPEAEATGRCEVRPTATWCASRPTSGPCRRRQLLRSRRGASNCRKRAPSSCARTAPRRRGCC